MIETRLRRASSISASAPSIVPTRLSMSTTALEAGETGWGIVGVSLRSADTRDALSPQDGLYTLAVRSSGGRRAARYRLDRARYWWRRKTREPCLQPLPDPRTRIVTLTITEKAYLRAAGGGLDTAHPDISQRPGEGRNCRRPAWLSGGGASAVDALPASRPSPCSAATISRPMARRCTV